MAYAKGMIPKINFENEEEIKLSIESTKNTIQVIINLIIEFTKRINEYKKDNNAYEFNDIAIMAINILRRRM